ncbi:hypothetical protein [Microbacterium sp. LWH13-1.2]|uniref:hypothetical protein n=1 Tax=Microbacterium sp. LWH13-1.2 TaxID=3135260 RepID=UPI003138BF9A
MVKYRLVGGPRADEVVEELPDGYRSQGTGSGSGGDANFEILMTAKYVYEVTAKRDGQLWFIRIPQIDGATQARTREEIPAMARDYIAIALDVTTDSFDVAVTVFSD